MRHKIFTIGHSTHDLEHFVSLLNLHKITALCDVRSRPYSQRNPQFNREALKTVLNDYDIAYVFFGKELGARSEDATCYMNGKVQYDRLAKTALFQDGLDRLKQGASKHRITLMCAEKDPLECHRTILVARYLQVHEFDIEHIHADGGLESHEDSLNRLVRIFNLPESDMFRTHEQIVDEAYRLQGDRIAFDRGESLQDSARFRRAAG
jgi:uncharacterized protein (DUF488 family)